MKSVSLMDKVMLLTTLKKLGIIGIDIAIDVFRIPEPIAKAINIARTNVGKVIMEFIRSVVNRSKLPPKYPEMAPIGKPMPKDRVIESNAINKDHLVPHIALLSTSLPNMSVPHKCSADGGSNLASLMS